MWTLLGVVFAAVRAGEVVEIIPRGRVEHTYKRTCDMLPVMCGECGFRSRHEDGE